jgi:hypothetical protein
LVVIILTAVIVIVGFGSTPQKAAAHSGTWQVNAGNGLNLRTGPGGGYARIETMANGTLVKARGHSGNWMKLTSYTTGRTGWAWLAYLVPAGGSGGTTSGLQHCFANTWGQTFCAPDWIAQTAYAAARYWGASYWWLMSIASCESNFDPNAYNSYSGVSGIMQFQPSTMQWISPGASPWSVSDSMYTAAHMYILGLAYHWDCNHRI